MAGPSFAFREPIVERDGRRVYVRDYPGPAPAIVLMHGFPDSVELYDRLVPYLAGRRRVVTFDFIGWGRSDKSPDNDYTYENLTRDLNAVIDTLGLETPDLVAHDASGPPAIEWTLAHPDRVGHLVLLNCFYMFTLLLRPPEGVLLYMLPGFKYVTRAVNELSGRRLNRMLYRWQLRRFLRDTHDKDTVVPMLYEHWITSWPAFRDLVGRLLFKVTVYAMPSNMARLRAYRGRVRIIFGARDPYLNLHVAQSFHRAFANSDLFLLPHGYHYVQVDEPRAVSRLVLEMRADAEPETAGETPGRDDGRSTNPLRRWLLTVPAREVDPDVRGFPPCPADVRQRIVHYFEAFLAGYHLAGRMRGLEAIARHLDTEIETELRGFAYEGAGMALSLLDHLTPWNRTRAREFVSGPARRFAVITMIGEGLALARLPWLRLRIRRAIRRFDPVWVWFVVDGFGFHEGFFHHRRTLFERQVPGGLDGYAARCFDRGLGRALWFVAGGDPARIAEIVGGFDAARQGDLWSGVGLASAYAGGIHENMAAYARVLDTLAHEAGRHRAELGVGAVFAGDTRYRAGVLSPWTALACERLAGMSWQDAGRLVERTERTLRDTYARTVAHGSPGGGFEVARLALIAEVERHVAAAAMAPATPEIRRSASG